MLFDDESTMKLYVHFMLDIDIDEKGPSELDCVIGQNFVRVEPT